MPDTMSLLDDAARKRSANAIAHFLQADDENGFSARTHDSKSAGRGARLFDSVGCVACHAPRDASGGEMPIDESTPMGPLSQKYSFDALVEFLENPIAVRSSGRMPKFPMTHQEAEDISNYLLQNAAHPVEQWKSNPSLVEKGRELFSEFRCASCHTQMTKLDPAVTPLPALQDLRSDQGCLSNQGGNWPDFQLDPLQTKHIRVALESLPTQLTGEQQIEVSLKTFNCIACHSRDDLGGVTPARDTHFHTTNMNLGDQGRIPPTLTGVGAKLKSKWMRDVLVNGRVIRPYMNTRMPQYGETNVGHLVGLFQRTDSMPVVEHTAFKDRNEIRKIGLKMAGNKGLNCVACHTYKYKLSDTMPAVDLTEMAERLKKDWFYHYMLTPQQFSPNTVMPSFWPGGKAIRKDLEGDSSFQVEALWQYLVDGRQAGTPSGVVREPLEIVVKSETQMLRRSYPGIGKRGIGVGYPGGANLAWDAEQLRLAMIWKGKFVDPGGVWTGQGSGNVRPLSRPIHFAKGPDLESVSDPWIVDDGRPPLHKFRGYYLDAQRRPTFRYWFKDIEVEDFFLPGDAQGKTAKSDTTQLTRTVTLFSSEGYNDLRFRVASAKDIRKLDGQRFSIGDIQIRIVSDHQAELVDGSDGKRLRIRLDVAEGEKQKLVIEYRWE